MNKKILLISGITLIMMCLILSASAANITDKSTDKLADDAADKKVTSPSTQNKVKAQESYELNIDMTGALPDEGTLYVFVNGRNVAKVALNGMMQYTVILDVSAGDSISFELKDTDKYELISSNATGSKEYSLKFNPLAPTHSGDNSTNTTPTNSTPPKNPDSNNTTTTTTIKKTTTSTVKNEPENKSKEKPKHHETANPILLLILAASVIGAVYQIRRNDK